MNHLFRTRPHFQSVIEKQFFVNYRLHKDRTTRTAPEVADMERTLQPIPACDVELPKIPLVRPKGTTQAFILIGEIAQIQGKVILVDLHDGSINLSFSSDQLELIPPDQLP